MKYRTQNLKYENTAKLKHDSRIEVLKSYKQNFYFNYEKMAIFFILPYLEYFHYYVHFIHIFCK